MRKIKYILFLMLALLMPSISNASNFDVESYDITIDITKDRLYTYEENINIRFKEQNVQIEKELNAQVKDFKVNANYSSETSDKKIIKIKSKNEKYSTYKLNYNYKYNKYDRDIYVIDINNTYNATLKNISFYILLDEDFNKKNVDIYLNGEKNNNITYDIKNNKLTGKIGELKETDILTIKIDYSKIYLTPTTAIATIMPIILTIISGVLWFIYGKDLRYKPTKAYELPKNMNSLEIGLLLKGYTNEKDAFSLLIELANKGYIKIVENNNNDYTLKRIKDYDGKKYNESMFIKALFRKTSSVSFADYINIISERKKGTETTTLDKTIKNENIYNRFQRAKNVIIPISNESEEKNKYFEKTSERKRSYLILILATILMLLTSIPFIEINRLYFLPISVLFSIITLYILMNLADYTDIKINKNTLSVLVSLSLLMLIVMLLPTFRRNRIYLITFMICALCIIAILIFYKFMPKRTIYGTKLYSKIDSFKNFIWADNKKDYDIIMSKDENYLYNILAASYTLELEQDIYKKMKEYDVKKPDWFELKEDFTVQKLSNSIERLYNLLKEKKED
jgi:hypothetical protein